MTDRWWCNEGCGFIDHNHRFEQWANVTILPAAAIEAIRKEALEEAAERAVNYCAPLFPWNDQGSYAAGLRAAIMDGNINDL